jgi:hypothetical protein
LEGKSETSQLNSRRHALAAAIDQSRRHLPPADFKSTKI